MKLGAFSISLTVKDLAASKVFYEQLGFTTTGNVKDMWLIMKNQNTIVGLFQGMFDKNMLTFNPGWDQDAQHIEGFTDIRSIQKRLKADGVTIENETDETTNGPASFIVIDPDGNPVLFDQHV